MRRGEWALQIIGRYRHSLTRQQFLTLTGQAKAGDPDAAIKGLDNILKRRKAKVENI